MAVVVLLLLILITAVVIVITCNMRQKKKARGTTSVDFHGTFTMGTGGHYIIMLPAGGSISTSHGPLASSFHGKECYGTIFAM